MYIVAIRLGESHFSIRIFMYVIVPLLCASLKRYIVENACYKDLGYPVNFSWVVRISLEVLSHWLYRFLEGKKTSRF